MGENAVSFYVAEGECSQEGQFLIAHHLARTQQRVARDGIQLVRMTRIDESFVVVAEHARCICLADSIDAGQRIRPISDDIAEYDDAIHPQPVDFEQDRLQGLQIAVDVGQNR